MAVLRENKVDQVFERFDNDGVWNNISQSAYIEIQKSEIKERIVLMHGDYTYTINNSLCVMIINLGKEDQVPIYGISKDLYTGCFLIISSANIQTFINNNLEQLDNAHYAAIIADFAREIARAWRTRTWATIDDRDPPLSITSVRRERLGESEGASRSRASAALKK